MRFIPFTHSVQLHQELSHVLKNIRAQRNFNAENVLIEKCERLQAYLSAFNLRALVVGVSGGIDSAVSLGIASNLLENGLIDRVVPVLLPLSGNLAATGQLEATTRGIQVCAKFALKPVIIELDPTFETTCSAVESALQLSGNPWARGQLTSYIRTPALYYTASILWANKLPAAVLGTTNRDEGAYLGFFGKASDGMVDIQILSDLHKSEVYALAKQLDIPETIINAIPTGDMYDGRIDEEVFGAPYDFVELFLAMRCMTPINQSVIISSLGSLAREQFDKYYSALQGLHNYNAHKYLVGSPAIHLDVLAGHVPGGWRYAVWYA
jgi:NAD+ synthase (glutamine-hydrolysing)